MGDIGSGDGHGGSVPCQDTLDNNKEIAATHSPDIPPLDSAHHIERQSTSTNIQTSSSHKTILI